MKKGIFFSIIIPNWNGREFLSRCIESVCNQLYDNYEVIVVDNGSGDDSVNFLKTTYPQVRVICFKKNRGFSSAVNEGIKQAKGNHLFLLNNDTVMESNCLQELAKQVILYGDDRMGSFQCKMVKEKDRKLIDSVGIEMSEDFFAQQIGSGEEEGSFKTTKEIWGVCAGAAVYRKDMLEDISENGAFFDESFFAFYEDVDLAFRARIKGWRCLFVAEAIVFHIGSASTLDFPKKIFLLTRNRWFTLIKNLSWRLICQGIKDKTFFDQRTYNYYKGEKRYDILFMLFVAHFALIPYLIPLLIKRKRIFSGNEQIK